jgi:MOSC domain-containing protein YiiM
MRLVSVNTGMPCEVRWHGRIVTTGIFKEPVDGRVALRRLNLDGDRQADLTVHGGAHKAVYCYSLAHYEYWKKEFAAQKTGGLAEWAGRELPMGMFGENFTIIDDGGKGSLEESVHLGDRFSVGTAHVAVTQPRLPCYKLGVRFGSDDRVKRFLPSGRTGFYVTVLREGEVGAGDEMKLMEREANAVAVSEITRLYVAKRFGEAEIRAVRRALRVEELPESWKEYFRDRLGQAGEAN